MTWRNLDKSRPDSAHYMIMALESGADGMAALREMYPDGEADELNFVLFSTSGVHGSYCTIKDQEPQNLEADQEPMLTFLIVHPRLVSLRYGNCEPRTPEDFAFLRKLRESSRAIVQTIGADA